MGRLHPTEIQWATHAVNPIVAIDKATGKRGWACTKIAQGCNHCYAETLNVGRFGNGHRYDVKGNEAVEWKFDENAITSVLSRRKPATIFHGDMTDVFHENVPDAWLDRMFAAMALTPHLRHIVLTKRAARMRAYIGGSARADAAMAAMEEVANGLAANKRSELGKGVVLTVVDEVTGDSGFKSWPLPNVALGVSVATQRDADELVPELLATPAALRFVSYEPAIEAVEFGPTRCEGCYGEFGTGIDRAKPKYCGRDGCDFERPGYRGENYGYFDCHDRQIHAIIIGGESGTKARPFDLAWADSTIEQCNAAGVVAMLKQYGRRPVDSATPMKVAAGRVYPSGRAAMRYVDAPSPLKLLDAHGGNPSEWAERHRPYACSPERWPWASAVRA